MEGCYADALSKNPRTKGAVDLKLMGEPAGTTVQVTRNTVENASLVQCVTEAVHGVKADSTGSFVADWSLSFSPKA